MNEPIQEKAPKPPGLLPKHVQSWLILGLAVLMVTIMWLTGSKKAQPAAKTNAPVVQTPAPLEVNETKIAELQTRIQELQRQQLAAQSALVQQNRLVRDASAESQPGQPSYGGGNAPAERAEDPIRAEHAKRKFLSLFASNIALSYRKDKTDAPARATESGSPSSAPESFGSVPGGLDATQLAQLLRETQPPALAQPVAQPGTMLSAQTGPATPSPAGQDSAAKEVTNPAAAPTGARNAAAGKTYVLFEGTVLETVLINRLDGSFSGPVECLLTNDVYSHDRQHLLIPAGTKVLGEAKKVEALGQTRLAVAFHRLIMPDGYSVSLDQFKGLNQIGDTGHRDKVNNHYFRIFGTSLAIGALGAVSEAGTGGALTASGSDLMRQGLAQSLAQSSEQILDKFLNIMPTVTIREGHRVKVYLSGDLALPDYVNHKMPSDL